MDDPAADAARLTRVRAWRIAKVAYVLLAAAALAWVTWRSIPEWRASGNQLPLLGSAIFVACWVAMATMLGALWAGSMWVATGVRLRPDEWLRAQAAAWAGRYLPGKIGLIAGKLSIAERDGVGVRALMSTVLFEQLGFVAAGASLVLATYAATPLFGAYAPNWPKPGSALQLALSILIFAALIVAARVGAKVAGLAREPGWANLSGLALGYVATHVTVGIGFVAILASMAPDSGMPAHYAIGLLAAAHVGGILAVFAPAGIGVREAILVAGLAPYMPLESALVVATALRLLSLGADAVFCATATGVAMLLRKSAAA